MKRLTSYLPSLLTVGYGAAIIAVIHIVATFIPAYFSSNVAYGRLSDGLPANSFVVLPAARPGVQVIPYQLPDTRYAICKFDVRKGVVSVEAVLPGLGWTLSIYDGDGSSFYDAPGRGDGEVAIKLLLVPKQGYFFDASAPGSAALAGLSEVRTPNERGIVVIRAPLGGLVYAVAANQALSKAMCKLHPYS